MAATPETADTIESKDSISIPDAQSLRILVVRADRLGDVILSTPVFEVIKQQYPHCRLTVMVRESVAPILRGLPSIDELIIYDPQGRHAGFKGLWRLIKELRAERFRIAVVLQSQWKIAAAVYFAWIKYRVGPLSKFHSFWYYNRGLNQHRSQVEMHEADYNLQLLRRVGIRVGTRHLSTRVAVTEEKKTAGLAWLKARGWNPDEPLIAIHPGMGGSALNWPEGHYLELIRALIKEGQRVLVTVGPTEGPIAKKIQDGLGDIAKKVIFYGGDSKPEAPEPIDTLAGLLTWSSLVIAPSTGPLHLAVALGKPVVTFFPPIRVQSAIRWGPYVSEDHLASVLVPDVYCGEDFRCRLQLCNYYPCMKTLTVSQVLEQTSLQIKRSAGEKNKG